MIESMVSNYVALGIIMSIMGGLFGIIFGIGESGLLRFVGIGLGCMSIIGICMVLYFSPIENAELKVQQEQENSRELQIKQLDCKSIQQYLLDSIPTDNTTTQYAHSVFDLKCKGVPLT